MKAWSQKEVLQQQHIEYLIPQVPLVISFQLGLLHATWLGQHIARTSLLRWYLRWTSVNLGVKYDSPDSRAMIPRFIEVLFSPSKHAFILAWMHEVPQISPKSCCIEYPSLDLSS